MVPCPRCSTLLRAGDPRCVHCGERVPVGASAIRSTAAAALLGLAVACTGDGGKTDSGHTGGSGGSGTTSGSGAAGGSGA